MTKDLKLVGDQYDWFLTIFYIAYIIFEFLAMMWKVVPPHNWAATTVLAWLVICFSVPIRYCAQLEPPGSSTLFWSQTLMRW